MNNTLLYIKYYLFKTPGGDRTRNLPIRSRTPYPFGHGGYTLYIYFIFKYFNALKLIIYFQMMMNLYFYI